MSTTLPEFDYDVFISYSHHDQTWVRDELLPGLEKAGLKICIDYRDFGVGAPIVREMERAVLTSRHTLLVLTPAYLESAWTDFEALMVSTLDPGSQKARLLPLLLKPCDLPLRVRYLSYADFTVSDDLTASWQRLLSALGVADDAGRQANAPRPPQYEISDEALERYYEQIIKQYGWIRIFGQTTPKPLQEVFTDVYMLDKPTAHRRFDPNALRDHLWNEDRGVPLRVSERVPAEQLLGRGSKFFILGKPGAGKTTFLKRLAVREAQRGQWGPSLDKIPIFVSLKQFAESGKSLFDFIVEQFAVCSFPDATSSVKHLLEAGEALVLFDGLDEVQKISKTLALFEGEDVVIKATKNGNDQRGQTAELIEKFARHYEGCHIVLTCRIAALEYTLDPAFTYLELADFAPDQVRAFVRNWFWDPDEPGQSTELTERMLMEWERSEHAGIRDLARNPLLLTLLCLNYAETLSFPARRVEIYQEALDALLKKWDASRQIQRISLYRALSLGRKQQMFTTIAYNGFIQNEILFAQSDLEGWLQAYLVHVPEVPLAVDIDVEAVLQEVIEQHGIFAEQAHRLFSFAHLTFQEYYVARYLVESSESNVFHILMTYVADSKWREIFLLTASLLPDATSFLLAFEQALHRLIAQRPRLVAWLRWVDARATGSKADYRRTATRIWYTLALIGSNARAPAKDLARDRVSDIVRDRDLYRAFTRVYNFALDKSYEIPEDSTFGAESQSDWMFCLKSGDTDLVQALSKLTLPRTDASPSEWNQFAIQLEPIKKTHSAFRRYKQLETETQSLIRDKTHRPPTAEDQNTLESHIEATHLFYDCLQLAYTSDRRAFEDRILLPPPLTKQKA